MDSKRITAGVIFNAGHVNLSKPEILQTVKEAFITKKRDMMQKIKNELQRFNKRKAKARKVMDKVQKTHPQVTLLCEIESSYVTTDDLKALIMLLKKKNDGAMPKSVIEIKQKWEKVRFNPELTNQQHLLEQGFDEERVSSVLLLQNEAEPTPVPEFNPDLPMQT